MRGLSKSNKGRSMFIIKQILRKSKHLKEELWLKFNEKLKVLKVLIKASIWEIIRAMDLMLFSVNSYLSCYQSLTYQSKLEILQSTCIGIIYLGKAIQSLGSQ